MSTFTVTRPWPQTAFGESACDQALLKGQQAQILRLSRRMLNCQIHDDVQRRKMPIAGHAIVHSHEKST